MYSLTVRRHLLQVLGFDILSSIIVGYPASNTRPSRLKLGKVNSELVVS